MGIVDQSWRRSAERLAARQAERDRLVDYITRVTNFAGVTAAGDPSLLVQLKHSEHALLVLPGARLIEPRWLPGHWVGANTGMGFRINRGPRRRAGGTRRPYGRSGELPAAADAGVVTVTDHRVVFTGPRHAREWAFAEVLGYHHSDGPPWTAFPTRGRDRASGVLYDDAHADDFRFSLALGMARFHGSTDALVAELQAELADIDGPQAGAVLMPGAVLPPPGWYPDPYRLARVRWWDGQAWTGHSAP
ncbi:MAG: DUF2510 domain-containing protein [Acidimicrobiales bacterium]